MNAKISTIPRLTWLDYVLVGIASSLAGFSAGWGLGIAEIAYFFTVLIIGGTLVSALLQQLIPPSRAAADGVVYALFATGSVFFASQLNDLLPGEGFPFQLRIAGVLCWVLVFGSFCMWRDATLLFQAVPGIAIFGLVGTWDTFRISPFLFFVFLLCYATLFARAHARSMMQRASESGYHSTALNQRGGLWEALRRGPWRWMAGPEWALGSALAVIVFSLIGAPVFQASMSGFAGLVKLPQPPTAAMRRAQTGADTGTNFASATVLAVGGGPRGTLHKTRIFKVKYRVYPYLRYRTYREYSSRGWLAFPENVNQGSPEFELNVRELKRFTKVPFTLVSIEGHYDNIPIPAGELDAFRTQMAYTPRADGTVGNASGAFGSTTVISGDVRVPAVIAKQAIPPRGYLPPVYANEDGSTVISPRVEQLAQSIVRGITDDGAKAEAIRKEIAKRCRYNLDAASVPVGRDPVDYFLFDSKEGYCDLFASAMAVMCRAVHIPSRLVIGYAPFTEPRPQVDGYYSLYQSDYHAWAEVYYKDLGWMVYDATDGASEVPGHGRGSTNENQPWYENQGVQIVGAAAGVAIVGFGLFGLVRWARKNLRFGIKPTPMSILERGYIDFVKTVESKTGKPMRPSETPHEYLEAVRPYLDGSFAAVSAATDEFVSTYYGSNEPEPGAVEHVRELFKNAKLALKNVKRPK